MSFQANLQFLKRTKYSFKKNLPISDKDTETHMK